MIFIYLLYQNNNPYQSILRVEFKNNYLLDFDHDWKILLCLPCSSPKEKIIDSLGLDNQDKNKNTFDLLNNSTMNWKFWTQKILENISLEIEENEPKKENTKEPEHEREIEKEVKIEDQKEEEQLKLSKPDESLSNSLENIKFTIAEENTKLNNMLHKISMFKTNVMKIQNNLHSIKKYKLPTTTQNTIPPIFASERPSRNNTQELITLDDCKQWLKNKSMNPKTNRKIEKMDRHTKNFFSCLKCMDY